MKAKNSSATVGETSDGYHVCSICGKRVFTQYRDMSQWLYKTQTGWACSYTCWKKLQIVKPAHKTK